MVSSVPPAQRVPKRIATPSLAPLCYSVPNSTSHAQEAPKASTGLVHFTQFQRLKLVEQLCRDKRRAEPGLVHLEGLANGYRERAEVYWQRIFTGGSYPSDVMELSHRIGLE